MNLDQRIQIYKEVYNSQIERKDNLKSNLVIPTAVIGLFGALTNYFLKVLEAGISGFLDVIFVFLFLIYIYMIASAIYYLYISWGGYDYAYFPKSQKIEKYYNDLKENKNQYENYENEFKKYLIKTYTKINDINFKHNKKLRENLLKIQKNLSQALIIGSISLFVDNINMLSDLLNYICIKGGIK